MSIGRDHPLRKLFGELVARRFYREAGVPEPRIVEYVAALLTDFTHVDSLYRIRNARGQRLEEVAEMLIESDPRLEAASFDRERAVRKHIGDYTLFLTGMFPEYVASLSLRQLRLDAFIDYLKAGKESYRIVSAFDQFEYRTEAPLFRQLADSFESCVFGLNLVKRDLEALAQEAYSRWRNSLQ
ncbi:MAG: hypothetical protein EHM61_09470 [Acidobacteria bacterium]|nr:MAG: hypothetical protein EHM61_09470 [Acidobacteriota bacterium]